MTCARRSSVSGVVILALGAMVTAASSGVAAPTAAAAAEGPYDGSWDNHWASEPPPSTFTGSAVTVGGTFLYRGEFFRRIRRITFDVVPKALPAGCSTTPTSAPPIGVTTDTGNVPVPFEFSAVPPCNGTYDIVATATADNALTGARSQSLVISDAAVARPPPPVTDLRVTVASDRSVAVRWSAPAGYAPPPADFVGYRVVRVPASGPSQTVAEVGPDRWSASDTPSAAGRATYRVYALRAGPHGLVASSARDGAVTVPRTPSTTSPGRAPGGGSGPGAPPGSSGGGGAGPPVPTTVTLPFDRPPPPGSDDEFFSTESADAVRPAEPATGGPGGIARDLLLPMAAGLVLLIWALHGRALTRAARESR
ncbi:MAG: hypothetical protein ACRD29_10735 [Acidimicrobiales bacterium]